MPDKIKQELIPRYEGFPDIQNLLKESNDGLHYQDTFDYCLSNDKYYKGTKWESHLFEVFPELEEFYDPMYKHNANLDLNIKKQEDIL